MGRVDKGEKCSVKGCSEDAVRSINVAKAKTAGLDVEATRRAYLCKEHYKEYKKGNKKDAQIEKWRHGVA
ncbi:hypothetical protein JXL21_13570 [Candidatus Bathyarchaeota archaeon]|nr:hypothetical protein [Candidatus Bathyarchaeota archaeon]